jgi:hypothetical protein
MIFFKASYPIDPGKENMFFAYLQNPLSTETGCLEKDVSWCANTTNCLDNVLTFQKKNTHRSIIPKHFQHRQKSVLLRFGWKEYHQVIRTFTNFLTWEFLKKTTTTTIQN